MELNRIKLLEGIIANFILLLLVVGKLSLESIVNNSAVMHNKEQSQYISGNAFLLSSHGLENVVFFAAIHLARCLAVVLRSQRLRVGCRGVPPAGTAFVSHNTHIYLLYSLASSVRNSSSFCD